MGHSIISVIFLQDQSVPSIDKQFCIADLASEQVWIIAE